MRQQPSMLTQQGQLWAEHSLESTMVLHSQAISLCQHVQWSAPVTLATTMLLELPHAGGRTTTLL